MLKQSLYLLEKYLDGLTDRMVALGLFSIILFIRFPFFFRDYIDHDESTFILLGQSWVDGFLPYMQLWDLKPPLTFAFFASIIAIFGKSFIALRFAGSLLVLTTAFFTFKIGTKLAGRKVAFGAALSCVALLSLFGSLQGVMSEHICMAFFTPALYLLISKQGIRWFFVAGILMGMVVMVKLNMAYPVLLLGLYFCFDTVRRKKVRLLWNLVFFGLGILIVITATLAPYYLNGHFPVWWKSVILAPLEYTTARRYSLLKLAPSFLMVIGFLLVAWRKKYLDFNNQTVVLLIVAIAGVLLSFLKGGRVNGHYLIQLYPMLVVLVAVTLSALKLKKKVKIPSLALLVFMLIPLESYLEYGNIIQHKARFGTLYNGEGFSLPKYIKENDLDTKNILFLAYHIGYWNLGELPPSKASTHPSNICRDELYPFFDNPRKNSLEELKYIMEELRPKTVVLKKHERIFQKKEVEENAYMKAYLAKHYNIHAEIESAQILQRLEGL